MELENLEMKVETALFRIKDLYDRTDGKCVLSFSGGKDSTIVAELYLIAMARGMVGDISFIFADTQVEYDAIYRFIEWFNENRHEVVYLKPRKPFAQVLKEYEVIRENGYKRFKKKDNQTVIFDFIEGEDDD